jgi:hypothetical protein
MRRLLIFPVIVLSACGGSLSDEQRKQIKEGMEHQKIVKVSDADILAEALKKGQYVLSAVHPEMDQQRIDSLEHAEKVNIRFAVPGTSNARTIEQELIEAYVTGIADGTSGENLQKIWTNDRKNDYDTVLFSKPQLRMKSDGVEELVGIWNIYIARKDIILDIGRNR